jgi:hypothetical protein
LKNNDEKQIVQFEWAHARPLIIARKNVFTELRRGFTDSKDVFKMKFLITKNRLMNKRKIISAIVLFWLATIVSAVTCMAAEKGQPDKNAGFDADALDALRYIREEVKLARDLYKALAGIWQLDVFKKAVNSKQSLMDAVSYLLKQHGIDEPEEAACKYANADLRELYSYLIDQGKVSRNNAIDVTILIEQTVIADLNDVILQTNEKDVQKVLTLLMKGSEKHLHALDPYLVMY